MTATTSSSFVKNFEKNCDDIVQNCEPVIIARDNGNNVVVVSQAEYDNLIENLYIRQSAHDYARLLKSIEEAKAGKLITLDIGDQHD